MVQKIHLFMPPRSQYGVMHHFTLKLAEALVRLGIDCKVLEAEWDNPKPFLEEIFQKKPDCTLSFNGLLPDEEGRFFCDMIGIPHVACLVDSPNHFFSLIHSPNTIVACSDRFGCDFFRGINCRHVLFMPHGVEKDLAPDLNLDRIYDVTVLSSLVDYETLRSTWDDKYSPIIVEAMGKAYELTLNDQSTSYVQAFVNALDTEIELKGAIDPKQINFMSVLDDLEMYIKGISKIDLLRSIHDAEVHIFGANADTATWNDYLDDKKNIVIHEPVPYIQALEIIGQSKIMLNITPWIKNGSHERIFSSMALETLTITDENIFLKENFENGKDIVMYTYKDLNHLNGVVNEYLSDEQKRATIAHKSRDKVMRHHTWDNRAKTLIEELTPILDSMKKEA